MASQYEHAAAIWPILIDAARRRKTMTYAQVADAAGTGIPQGVGRYLTPIQDYCIRHNLPPLTVVVVQKETGRPGPGFAGGNFRQALREVFDFAWPAAAPSPYDFFLAQQP